MIEKTLDKPAVEFDAGPKIQFPEIVKIEPCSFNECAQGHKWAPQLAVGQCPGCGGPILAVRMLNCPVCNEPVVTYHQRIDHTSPGMGIAGICRGQKGLAETNFVEMKRNHAVEAVQNWDEKTGRMVV